MTILAAPVKSKEGLSHWELAKCFDRCPGGLRRCGLGRPYSKCRLRMSRMGSAVLRKIMLRTAGDVTAHGKVVDSRGFRIS